VIDLEEGESGWNAAERPDLDQLFSLTYEELRRLATSVRRTDACATVNPTALVNEAWLKLAHSPPLGTLSRLQFKRIAARAMRQVLVEAARRRNAEKRGGGKLPISLDEDLHEELQTGEELLALDQALGCLARMNPRQAAVIECRFFGGLEVAESAELLDVSEATIERDWRVARAWLAQELGRSP
jgi:RNA polymerase sigma factor (TIGR02999 family)